MIITEISACKKSRDRCNVYVDDGFYCALFFDIALEYGLKKGKVISKEELDEIVHKDRCRVCFMKACSLLSIRARGEKELTGKLREKKFDVTEIEAAMKLLKERGYIDDLAFAREYAEYLQKKGYGGFAIKQRLYQKGIDRELTDMAVAELSENEVLEAAMEYGKRTYMRARRETDKFKRKNKFLAAMGRHGFDYSIAKEIYHTLEECDD